MPNSADRDRGRAIHKLRRAAGRVRRGLANGGTPAPAPPRGRRPEVSLEQTELGSDVDQAVLRAKQRMRIGVDEDYDLLYDNFDVLHYLLQAPGLIDRRKLDLIRHFLDVDPEMGRSPDPNFSMSNYLARYPDRASGEGSPYLEWLKHGRDDGEIADPAPRLEDMADVLGLPVDELVDRVVDRRDDLQQRFRTGKLGEMLARAAEVEPLIAGAMTELARPKLLPLTTMPVTGQAVAIYRAQESAGFRRARLVMVINQPRWGGGRRIEGHIAHALAAHVDPDEIVVVYTDKSNETASGRYPDGVREIDFAQICGELELEPEQAQAALAALLRSFCADAIVNINSRMLYHALRAYGPALAASERLFLCFFCNEKSALGVWQGWSLGYFYRTFDYLAGVITDSEHLRGELIDKYKVLPKDRDRLHVFRAPVDGGLPVIADPPVDAPDRRPQIFWAGRWDRQKRIDLFVEIARLMPDVDFRMWGAPVMGGGQTKFPPNVAVEGRYGHISDIPLREADAWLYTSGWDGVPSQLLEVAMTAIPIVATRVGGTGEVVGDADGWPVGEDEPAEAYVDAIREVLAGPEAARRQSLALRDRLLGERTEKAYAAQVVDVLLDATHDGQEDDR